jgi:pimeloyl-ACP methyl ester carboxylesterase
MANEPFLPGYQLPIQPQLKCSFETEGFLTPIEDLFPQIHSVLPRRVIPIIFLPGIMGSNLRMTPTRQRQMGRNNNISWRPDSLAQAKILIEGNSAMRQDQLDPLTTEVDEYDPITNPTGDDDETSEMRHDVVKVKVSYSLGVGINTPLLMDDPVTVKPRRTKDQKARERGWGEIFFKSYQDVLELCELHLNTAFVRGQLNPWWKKVVDIPPANWQANPQPALGPIDEPTLRQAVKNCWFPIHAMGYNWLQSNKKSGMRVAERIEALMKRYQDQGFKCEKVIVVTHSMGGLVARALIHPAMGNLNHKVLGIVHGVMPATGAAAAYKRMRCGFEDPGLNSLSPINSITSKVLGNFGTEVTAVLGNAQGGLELLPSQAYGNNWLRVTHKGQVLKSLPQKGDPYEEIYKLPNRWYGLLRNEWLNPARQVDAGFKRTSELLDKAKAFHNAIATTYHDQSFAHYGADPGRAAWHNVVWALDDKAKVFDVEGLQIATDNQQGVLHVTDPRFPSPPGVTGPQFTATLQAPNEPGDQTVPLHSADDQLRSGKFKGLFRQLGYEHQNSYKDERALHSTIYSLVRIAQNMEWSST